MHTLRNSIAAGLELTIGVLEWWVGALDELAVRAQPPSGYTSVLGVVDEVPDTFK